VWPGWTPSNRAELFLGLRQGSCCDSQSFLREKVMKLLALCMATAVLGVQVGWQKLPEGGMEYIIQFDSQTLEALKAGQPVQSDIPPGAGDVRSYRIVVGTERLPRDTPPEKPKPSGPWMPMTLTLFGLFASLGANVYLGWIVWGLRRRRQSGT
jgi:hypothetical protein